MNNFTLWLEFEVMNPCNWHIEHEFCNIHVDLPDGRYYGINVGTYKYLETTTYTNTGNGETPAPKTHPKIPDLFVEKLTRDCIEKAIRDLLQIGTLEELLNPWLYDNLC